MSAILAKISDQELHQEYVKRFTLNAGDQFSSPEMVAMHLRSFFSDELDREKFVIVYLNARNAHICTDIEGEGTLTTGMVYPREILKKILRYHASAIILAHNHPSGNPNPSKDDRNITERLKKMCAPISVMVHDHIILHRDGYTSFSEKGLI
jgi:DNA repair protein RadC